MRSTRSSTTRRSSSRPPRKPRRSCRSCSNRTACSRCRDSRAPELDTRVSAPATRGSAPSCDLPRPLAYEFAGLADDGDVDIARARPDSRPIGDVDTTQVETIQGFQSRDQLIPRRLWAGALQALDQNLGGDESLHGGVGGGHVLAAADGVLKFLDDRYGRRKRVRRHLTHADSGPVFPEVLDEGVRAVVREGYEQRALAGLLHLLDECDACVGQNGHDHGLRFSLCEGGHRLLDFYGPPGVARGGNRRDVFFFLGV